MTRLPSSPLLSPDVGHPRSEPGALQGRPPKSWWGRNWKWMVPLCVVTPLLLFGGLITLVLLLVFGLIQSTWAYEEALAAARSDVEVTAALGTPIEAGRFVTGNVQVNPGSGYADLVIPISGPRGEGTLYVEAEKARGQWYFTTLEVTVAGTNDSHDLLAGP